MSTSSPVSEDKLSCCISLCRNYKNPYAAIDLYSLPEDADQRMKFSQILSIPYDVSMKSNARVCALHFRSKVSAMQTRPDFLDRPTSLDNVDQITIPSDTKSTSDVKPWDEDSTTNSLLNLNSPLASSSSNSVVATSDDESNQSWSVANTPSDRSNNNSNDSIMILDEKSGNFLVVKTPDEKSNDSSLPESETDNSSEAIPLRLDCEDDPLNPAQLEFYMKSLMDFVAANEVIRRFPPANSTLPVQTTQTQTDDLMSPSITLPPVLLLPDNLNHVPSFTTPNQDAALKNSGLELPEAAVFSTVLTQSKNTITNSITTNPILQKPTESVSVSSGNLPSLAKIAIMVSGVNASTSSSTVTPSYSYQNASQSGNPAAGPVTLPSQIVSHRLIQFPSSNAVSSARNTTYIPNGAFNRSVLYRSPPMQPSTGNFFPFTTASSTRPQNQFLYTSNRMILPNIAPRPPFEQGIDVPGLVAPPSVQFLSAEDRYRFQNTSSPQLTVPAENSTDKDAGLYGLLNVATVYGSETPPSASTPELRPVAADKSSAVQSLNPQASFTAGSGLDTNNSVAAQLSNVGSDDKVGPVIVDVLGAIEGGKDLFVGNKIPFLIYDNLKLSSERSSADPSTSNSVDAAPNVMIVTSKNTIFSLQSAIPVIPNGTATYQNTRKLFCLSVPATKNKDESAELLRTILRNEKYLTGSVWWLAQRHVLPLHPPCTMCGSTVYVLQRNQKFYDGFCWMCDNPRCATQEPIKRPKFFERFTFYSLEDLLLLTYHWACQTPIEDVFLDLNLDSEKIWVYYRALQKLCRQVSESKTKLGFAGSVEAAVVKLGNSFVFGAYDRKSENVRLEVIPEIKALNSPCHIDLLKKWLYPNTTLITEKQLPSDVLPGVRKMQSKSSINHNVITAHPKPDEHVQNILNYLTKNMMAMFGKTNYMSLPLDIIENHIYELEWREKYAKSVDMAFWSIINHIRELNNNTPYRTPRTTFKQGEMGYECFVYQLNENLRKRWAHNPRDSAAEKAELNKAASPLNVRNLPKSTPIAKSYSRLSEDFVKNLHAVASKVANIRELFKNTFEVPGGSSYITSKTLLAIKIRFDENANDRDLYKSDCICLGLKLRQDGFISNPVKWLVKKAYVKNSSPCYVCKKTALLRENLRFSDGCSWLCQNPRCKFENVFKRPHLFAIFAEYSMAHVAAMIFHWTVQSDVEIIASDAPMDSTKISHAWRSFQIVCSTALKRDKMKLGGENTIVEVALVRFGKLHILGAMDRKTKRTYLKVFQTNMLLQVERFYRILYAWIMPRSFLVIDSTEHFTLVSANSYRLVAPDTTITDKSSVNFHVLNINHYLQRHVFSMFGHLKAESLSAEMAQIFLDELMWRERYGKFPQLAFAKIMHEIFYLEKHGLYPNQTSFGKGVLMDEPSDTPKLKEVRVLLHRIPDTVLKFYNCFPIDSSKQQTSKSQPESDDEPEFLEVRAVVHKPPSEIIDLVDDEEEEEMIDVVTIPKTNDNAIVSDNIKVENSDSEILRCSLTNDIPLKDSELICVPSPNIPSGKPKENFVPPLVIRTSNKKKRKIIIMSKICDSELEPDIESRSSEDSTAHFETDESKSSSSLHQEREVGKPSSSRQLKKRKLAVTPKDCDTDLNSSRQSSSSEELSEQENERLRKDSRSPRTQNSDETEQSSSKMYKKRSVVLRRIYGDTKPTCIECGEENADLMHFMKPFSCADCKSSVYTTCCSNAFFEHRGSLLFGKRMPRRGRDHIGLHRPMPLLNTWYCSCGFSSRHGNALAAHLIKCSKTVCFQWDVS